MVDLLNLDWLAILVAAVVSMLIGAAWYSPFLFGEHWLKAIGKTKDELVSPLPAMIGSAVSCLVTAVAMAVIIRAFAANSAIAGALIGGLCGIGLVAMAMLSASLFTGSGWRLYLIQTGYRVIYLVVIGLLLGAWGN